MNFERILPQRLITKILKKAANCAYPPWKNWMIRRFIRKYQVNMQEACIPDPTYYKNFNDFFIRALDAKHRPIMADAKSIVSPVDGCVREIGKITHGKIFNAKQHFFTLPELLGGHLERCIPFFEGTYANLYLAPKDYHRVHMPYPGRLNTMIYIPGKLFSVKESTVKAIPGLFSKNERLVLFFDTSIGPMIMVLVGAMIVGNLHVVWHGDITRQATIREWNYEDKSLSFNAGDEIGHFKLGSTVILLFPNKEHLIEWEADLNCLHYGQKIGQVL